MRFLILLVLVALKVSTPADGMETLWTVSSNVPVQGIAVGHNGTVYVSSGFVESGMSGWPEGPGIVRAITPSGDELWRFKTDKEPDAPEIAIGTDGTIYLTSHDGTLYALDVSGRVIWRYQMTERPRARPSIDASGNVYVVSRNALHAVSPSGDEQWRYTSSELHVSSPPVIGSDGTIYLVSSHRDGRILAFAPSGQLLWQWEAFDSVRSAPSIGPDGTLYVGVGTQLVALGSRGKELWRFATEATVLTEPAIGTDGTIYLGADDYTLYTLSSEGRMLWTYRSSARHLDTPVVACNGKVYVASISGELLVFSAMGMLVDSIAPTGRVGNWAPSPILVDDGTLYVGFYAESADQEYGCHAIATDGSGPASSSWPMGGASPQRTGRARTLHISRE